MDIRFRTRRLERCFFDSSRATREWGTVVGRRYVQRVEALKAADRFETLFDVRALDLHPLREGRRGQYAVRLTGGMRLIITRDAGVVTVEEVTDYHA